MPPPVHIDFVVPSLGCGRSVTNFWGWGAHRARLRCPDDMSDNDKYERGVPGGALNLNSTIFWHIPFHCVVELAKYLHMSVRRVAQPVWQLATGWTVRESNPGGGEIFRTHPDRPWGPPSLLYNRHRVFTGGKTAGAWCWPPTPF
jgi:hypothetical protein